MLICNLPKWKNFALAEELFDEFEELFRHKLILPVTSFSQYLLSLAPSEQANYNKSVARYFGTDIAKVLSDKPLMEIKTRESMVVLLVEYVLFRTRSTISKPGYGSVVYICDNITKKVIYTLNDYKLDDYQERIELNGCTQYISKFDNIVIAMSKSSYYKPAPADMSSIGQSTLF